MPSWLELEEAGVEPIRVGTCGWAIRSTGTAVVAGGGEAECDRSVVGWGVNGGEFGKPPTWVGMPDRNARNASGLTCP